MPRSIASVIANRIFHMIPSTISARDAAKFLYDNEIGAVVVVDDGELKGILSERDLVYRVIVDGKSAADSTVAEIMTAGPVTVQKDGSLKDAIEEMKTRRFRHVPVMDGDVAVGMISARDMVTAMHQELERDLTERDAIIFGAPIR